MIYADERIKIFINLIQPFEAANIIAAFFMQTNDVAKHSHKFSNIFQDDISYALALYSCM